MLQYRIPGAELLSAAVIGVCFVIALIVINLQPASRSRSFGVLGAAMVVASTVVEAANASFAGVYGTSTGVYRVGSIIVGALAAAGLVLLSLAVVWARKPIKRRGRP
jgi:hypothetical protein